MMSMSNRIAVMVTPVIGKDPLHLQHLVLLFHLSLIHKILKTVVISRTVGQMTIRMPVVIGSLKILIITDHMKTTLPVTDIMRY